jgi:pimeloyl-ACP methyl ester carboxylesterase
MGELFSRSEFVRVRGLRYHVRRWGDARLPKLILLHGWLDLSETFHYFVQPLLDRWQILAPDMRGFGYTEWQPGGYWFPDYVADVDALFEPYAADGPVIILGHSMGAQIAALYSGARPQRVSRLVCLDGPFVAETPAEHVFSGFVGWLDELRALEPPKIYDSFEQLAGSVLRMHPRLGKARAHFVARCWGKEDGYGRITLRADPQHKLHGPMPYRFELSQHVFRNIVAPTLFVDAERSISRDRLGETELARRRALIRNHRSVTIANTGHMLHFDAPEATAAAVRAFLSDLRPEEMPSPL